MRMFIDTSAFYALLDRTDESHLKAGREWNRILDADYTLVATNYVLVETLALLQSRIGLEAVRRFQEDVFPLLSLEFVTPKMQRLGTSALLASSRRRLSLVDCISFEVMRETGIRKVFTFDPHFIEQGFEVLP
ncbi:MAG: PIN domain-containing protein [Deltaproteobacteria bacterium]|nr:PIN domain-containing protein [Deltaproteobacteria bacterium]